MNRRLWIFALAAALLLALLCGTAALAADDPLKVSMALETNQFAEPKEITVSISVTNAGESDMPGPVTLYYPSDKQVEDFGSPTLSVGAVKSWSGKWKVTQAELDAGRITFKIRYSIYNDDGDLVYKNKNFSKKIIYTGAGSFSSEEKYYKWDCPECGRQGNTGNFCGSCAHPAPWNETENIDNDDTSDYHFAWDCPECGRKGNTENYCANCAHPAPWKETEATDQDRYAVGNFVTFGTYPQTAAGTDKTPIEWLVLERDGQKALLLSRYGLDAKPYNNEWGVVTWQTCTLRKWLNEDFYNKAFTATEQKGILETQVDNSSSQGYWSYRNGDVTRDKVFLLSYAEANKYLGVKFNDYKNIKSRMSPTAYALQQGASIRASTKQTTARRRGGGGCGPPASIFTMPRTSSRTVLSTPAM